MILDLVIRFKDKAGNKYQWNQGTVLKVTKPQGGGYYLPIEKTEEELEIDIDYIRDIINEFITRG